MHSVVMSDRDQNIQIAIAAASITQAAAGADPDGIAIDAALKMFNKAYDHIKAKTEI